MLGLAVLSVFAPKHCKRKHEEPKGKTKDPENSLESSDALLGTGQSMKELIRKESVISVSMLDEEDSGSGKGKNFAVSGAQPVALKRVESNYLLETPTRQNDCGQANHRP